MKRIKRVQRVERTIEVIHPEVRPEFFGEAKAQAQAAMVAELKERGITNVAFVYPLEGSMKGMLIVKGVFLPNREAVESRAQACGYDLYLRMPGEPMPTREIA